MPSPTKYTIIHDDIKLDSGKIQELAYSLSYLFYNFSGAVKLPAPVKYAYSLAQQVGERGNSIPHKYFDKINGLYFI